jgi:hypothetical protein
MGMAIFLPSCDGSILRLVVTLCQDFQFFPHMDEVLPPYSSSFFVGSTAGVKSSYFVLLFISSATIVDTMRSFCGF